MKEYTTLEKVASIYNGNSINAEYKKQHFVGLKTGYPFIGTKDVSFEGVVDYNNGVRIPYNTDYKTAEPDSVFICAEGGSAGRKIAYINEKVCFGNKLFCIKPKKNIYIGKFLYYYLMSNAFQTQFKLMLTGLIGGVSAKKFKSFTIPILEITEQERIVAFLDAEFEKIDQLKANAAAQLQAAKDLFQAALKEMLTPKEGWKSGVLGDIATILHGKNQKEVISEQGKYPIYGSGGNIMGYASEYLCDEGTTILGRKGTINNPIFINEKFWNVDTAFGIIAKGADKKFLYYRIKHENWQERNTGTTLPSLTQSVVLSVPIWYPSIDEQKVIADKLDEISEKVKALQSNYDQTLTLCNDLKQALLKSIFA